LTKKAIAITIAIGGAKMAQILVRDIEESVKEDLRRLARKNGRSMEAEVRDILRSGVYERVERRAGLGSEIAALFSGQGIGLEEPIPELRGFPVEPISFDE
jgi:plasmid stability protein